jgi:FkbM family methyltransferase
MKAARESRLGLFVEKLVRLVYPLVPRNPVLLQTLRSLRARLPMASETLHGDFMEKFGKAYPRAVFIQVGANDGAIYDPLRRQILGRRWSGIMIEPVPHIFAKLTANYPIRRRLILENVAIAAADGERDFYSLVPVKNAVAKGLPKWYEGLGSFYKDVILSHRKYIPDIESRIVTSKVACMTFESLCRKHDIKVVNLVQIDTEGYDFEVIKLIDFTRLLPELLVYEHFHLSAEDQQACETLLRSYGYAIASYNLDTLALHIPSISESHRHLLQAWRTLEEQSVLNKR